MKIRGDFMRKKIIIGISLFLAFVLLIVAIENKDKVKGTDGILRVAYKEIDAYGVDKSDYSILGSVTKYNEITRRNEILVWVMTENKVGIKNYHPLMFEILDNNKYEFEHYYRNFMSIREDVCYVRLTNGHSFMVNTSEYEYLNLYDQDRNLTQIKIDSVPFVYYTDIKLYNCTVVDFEGNEFARIK